MEKTISAFDARRQFGKMVQDVQSNRDQYVVERHGEPVAVVVPIEVYEQWKRSREAFFARAREIAEKVNMDPDEADALALEAVQAVRKERHRESSS